MYDRGAGLTKDEGEALKWYRKAADQGYADAQLSLGARYFAGRVIPQD
jgi:TPR repeat protein